jgi:O-antigen/teichoic acid export membrane protein
VPDNGLSRRIAGHSLHNIFSMGVKYAARLLFALGIGKAFAPAQFGVYTLITTTVTLISYLCQMGTASYCMFKIPGRPPDEGLRIFKSVLIYEAGLAGLILGGLSLWPGLREHFFGYFQIPDAHRAFFWMVPLIFADILALEFYRYLATVKRISESNCVSLFQLAVWVFPLAAWAGLAKKSLTVEVILSFWLAGSVTAAIYGAWRISPSALWRAPASFLIYKRAALFGFPLLLSGISQIVIDYSDRYFLARLASPDTLGVYAYQYNLILMVVAFVGPVLGNAVIPYTIEAYNLGQYEKAGAYLNHTLRLTLMALVPFLAVLYLARADVLLVLAKAEYTRYAWLMAFLVWIPLITLFNATFSNLMLMESKTTFLACATMAAALVNLGLNGWLIPSLGPLGAVISTLLSLLVNVGAYFILAPRMALKVRFGALRLPEVLGIGLGAVLLGEILSGWALGAFSPALRAAVLAGLAAAVFGGLYLLFGIWGPRETRWAAQALGWRRGEPLTPGNG